MKSIRLSLIVYFLVLVAASLGILSLIVYQFTEQALRAEETAKREKLEMKYEELREKEGEKLDQALAVQVRSLADRTIFQGQPQQIRWEVYRAVAALGLVGASAGPNRHVGEHLWTGMFYGWNLYPNWTLLPRNIQIREENLPSLPEGRTEYFQINTNWNRLFLSESLGEEAMPFEPKQLAGLPNYGLKYDEFELDPGQNVRRVTLKAPLSRYASPTFQPRGNPGPNAGRQPPKRGGEVKDPPPRGPGAAPPPGKPPERTTDPRLAYFQYAAVTTERDRAIEDLKAELEGNLDQHHADFAAQLASVRNRLFTLSFITFALTVAGGYTLVRHGLSPLRRLSDAVSRVSEKDMRLQVGERRLPRELQPIVERLQQTLGLLQNAFAREKQAAADISHELRTPLAALLTTTEVALRKPRSPDEYREVIQDCRTSCQQMSRLVERLLALSRLDAGVDRLRAQEVDAADLAEQCANLVRPLAEARGLDLLVRRNGPARASLDVDKLREILTNLLHNAIEYTQPRGRVEVAVEQENGHLSLEVRDTGIGIAPEAQRHIFERFYRADPARQAENMHAGLGLAIVKGYVDLMGGTISVESAQGQGSTFRVELPVRPHAATGA